MIRSIARRLPVVLALVVILVPYLWLVLTSFKNRVDAFAIPPKLVFGPTLDSYRSLFGEAGYANYLRNSFIVATATTVIALVLGVPTAYALARYRSRWNSVVLLGMLAIRLLPALVLAVPMFVLFDKLGWTTSFVPVVLAHLTFNLPFVVWMMRGFFKAIPPAIDEAAMIDGLTAFGAFFRTVLPLSLGGLAATAIFCLINSWNEFLFALVLTARDTATLPVAVPSLLSPIGTQWGEIAAVGTIMTIPVLLFAFLAQGYIVQGLTGGAVAGE
jgi:multiple sugar transport system permease protein